MEGELALERERGRVVVSDDLVGGGGAEEGLEREGVEGQVRAKGKKRMSV